MKHIKCFAKITALLIPVLFLCAYAPWENVPDLINVGGPFIDLTGSVGESIGNATEALEAMNAQNEPPEKSDEKETENETEPEPTPQPTPEADADPSQEEQFAASEQIRVLAGYDFIADPLKDKAQIVSVNNMIYTDVEDAVKALSKGSEDKEVILIDNYAEASVFERLVSFCRDNGIRMVIEIRE